MCGAVTKSVLSYGGLQKKASLLETQLNQAEKKILFLEHQKSTSDKLLSQYRKLVEFYSKPKFWPENKCTLQGFRCHKENCEIDHSRYNFINPILLPPAPKPMSTKVVLKTRQSHKEQEDFIKHTEIYWKEIHMPAPANSFKWN